MSAPALPAYASTRRALWAGIAAGAPFVLVVLPFSLLFGALASSAGLDLAQIMGMSVLVIAGAAQFTALQLLTEQTPAVLVLLSALTVNLRMAMYSAALAPHLGAAPLWQRACIAYFNVDQSYGAAVLAYERRPTMPLSQKLAFFFATMIPIAPAWYAGTYVGALTGVAILPDAGLDFALPIAFLAMVAPALRTRAHVAAAVTAAALGLLFAGLPYNLGLIPAALVGMAVGAELERRST